MPAPSMPRCEADLAARTKLDPKLVRGCLLALSNGGVVRPLDELNRVWEVAHDFVARLLAQVVASWRAAIWRRLLPWIAPASIVLWFAVLFMVCRRIGRTWPRITSERFGRCVSRWFQRGDGFHVEL